MKNPKANTKTDYQKQQTLRGLVEKVEGLGLHVRREKLTRGFGYSVSPGICRLEKQKLVFVNTHARIEEQIVFLEEVLLSAANNLPVAA